ncbi:hypothetical protein HORIV_30020 [Vreelandella olivaria]|uniref:Uncharacterized protein n=1 Tax=Vreelandella olivaria TaxID=390919 RepID=A0ABN5X170_9GAMM|nr:hypothetical protein HORIV_30020 [Halomonas olivaria]
MKPSIFSTLSRYCILTSAVTPWTWWSISSGGEEQRGEQQPQETSYRTHQGPLASGDYLNIQSFGDIVNQVKEYWEIDDKQLQEQNIQLEIRVIAIYGSEDMPTGASRTFHLDLNASPNHQLIPASVDTDRLNSRGQRKRVLEWAKRSRPTKHVELTLLLCGDAPHYRDD